MRRRNAQANKKRPKKTSETVSTTAEQPQNEILKLVSEITESAKKFAIHEAAQRSVNQLIGLAETGDEFSIILLFMIAVQTVGAINSGATERPDIFLKFSRNLITWPALISRKRAFKLANEALMKRLQLGEGDVYFSKKEWQPSAPSTQAALGLFFTALVRRERWELPPLTAKTKRIWFEKSWAEVLREGIAPEEVPKLAKLGEFTIGKESISRGMPEQTEGMKRDDMRAEIKRQLWNAFDRVVANPESK
jgi:hypothetical protein